MNTSPFEQQVETALNDPNTSSKELETLSHHTLINICLSRDMHDKTSEENLDRLLHEILQDSRFINQESIQSRMEALY